MCNLFLAGKEPCSFPVEMFTDQQLPHALHVDTSQTVILTQNKYRICYVAEKVVTSGTGSPIRTYSDHRGLQDCVRIAAFMNKILRKNETQLGEKYKIRFYGKRFSCCRQNSRWFRILT